MSKHLQPGKQNDLILLYLISAFDVFIKWAVAFIIIVAVISIIASLIVRISYKLFGVNKKEPRP